MVGVIGKVVSMENKILTKAIQKAQKNGYEIPYEVKEYHWQDAEDGLRAGWSDWEDFLGVESVIFDHDFAKALWGDTPETYWNVYEGHGAAFQDSALNWEYHLQQMVISEDPIKYLKENI